MLRDLLPDRVAFSVSTQDLDGALYPDEDAIVQNAVETRRREFTTARLCAREALIALGFASAPILQDGSRAPIWPEGVVGSITHCAGFRAAVARRETVRSLGIDAEPHLPLPDGVADLVVTAAEKAALQKATKQLPPKPSGCSS